jgi:mannose/fructose/N-acetylgalactosamine-specific phosphotransferase system component IIC
MSLFQAILLGLIAGLTSWWSPLFFGSCGDIVVGRPLIAGFISGLIMGDVRQGIILGAAIQAIYIGAVYVGGGVAANIAFAQYIVIPLCLTSGGTADEAIAMAIPLSMVGTLGSSLTMNANILLVHYQDKLIDQGKLKQAANVPVWGNITNFLVYFVPITLIDYFGTGVAQAIIDAIPASVSSILSIFGGMMPLLGFTIILTMILHEPQEFIYYFFGFFLVSIFNLGMIPVLVIALTVALIIYECTGKNGNKENA